MQAYMFSMTNDRLHCNCTVKNSVLLSSFGTKIWHVLFFHSNSCNNVPFERGQ